MSGPLTGTKVVELASIGPGPFCAMLLADMGADVLRLDRTEEADLGVPIEPRFNLLNRGRRSVAIDLKHAEGVATARRLIERADALIEGFRPGVAERLGLGPDECLTRNPRLVYGRVTGWGQDGPLASTAGHDINYIALAGALGAIGTAESPVPPLNIVGDYGGGGAYLAFGIVCALLECRSSGRGQVVDAAMVDGAASLLASAYGQLAAGARRKRGANVLDGGAPWYGVYETGDGEHVSVGAIEARFYRRLLENLGLAGEQLPDQQDREGWPALRARFAAVFRTKTRAEWQRLLEGTDACFAPVLSLAEAPQHPHNAARGTFVEVEGVVQPAPAPRFSRTKPELRQGPPTRGQHTDEALRDWGFSAAEIAGLRAARAIA